MYISDKDALKYACRFFLLALPVVWSVFGVWSWFAELFLLVIVLLHAKNSDWKVTLYLLAAGYLLAAIISGPENFLQIGFTPWIGIFIILFEKRGMATGGLVFWSLLLGAFLSAFPVLPGFKQALQPESIQHETMQLIQLYEQQGVLELFTGQGIAKEQIEKYVNLMVTIKTQITPAFLAILGMLEIAIGYLGYRFITKQKIKSFSLWAIPWYAVWVAIIGLALYLGGDYISKFVTVTGLNLMLIMSAICVILGFSCLTYFYRRIFRMRTLLIMVGILVFAFVAALFSGNPFLLGFLYFVIFIWIIAALFIGLFDLLFNFRKIPDSNKEGRT